MSRGGASHRPIAAARAAAPARARVPGALAAAAVVLATLPGASLAQAPPPLVLYVDAASGCTAGCGSQAAPFPTIQGAINEANTEISAGVAASATIQVAAGRYHERLFVYPDVNLRGAGAAVTTIDATGLGRSAVIFASGGTGRPRTNFSIDGFTITGGSGEVRPLPQDTVAGGGVFVFGDAVVTNNVITGNILSGPQTDWLGAGVYIGYGAPLIAGNSIAANVAAPPPANGSADAHGAGAGIFSLDTLSSPQIVGNSIHDNVATAEVGVGGGIRLRGGTGTVVTRNVIFGNRSTGSGGGISLYGEARIAGNLVYGNSSGFSGGGIDLFDAAAVITLNTIVGNSLTNTRAPTGYPYPSVGAGVSLISLSSPAVRISNNLIMGNSVTSSGAGAGLYSLATFPALVDNLFFADVQRPAHPAEIAGDYTTDQVLASGGNLSANPALVRQPLFFDVTVRAGTTTTIGLLDVSRYRLDDRIEYAGDGVPRAVTAINTSTLTVTFTPALPAASAAYVLLSDWGTAEAPPPDFHPTPGSPAVDAGTNADVEPVDLDGRTRPLDGNGDGNAVVDLGAYELPAPDLDGDCVPDALDCAPTIGSTWRTPDEVGDTLRLSAGAGASLGWTQATQANVYNVYRGSFGPGPFTYNHGCLEAGSPDTFSQDGSAPSRGQAFYYLVSGANRCGEGPLGSDSSGNADPNPLPCVVGTLDSDGDGVADIDDGCPLVASPTQSDPDCDGRPNACDDCPATPDPQQIDWNGDGIGDACEDTDGDGVLDALDCAPGLRHQNSLPGEVPVGPDAAPGATGTSLTWLLAVQAPVYNLYRGVIAPGVSWVYDHQCLAGSLLSGSAGDPGTPPPGSAYYYLASGLNTCGEGPLGHLPGGGPIPANGSCPTDFADADADGIPDLSDDCPLASNPGQDDSDADGRGDACDNCPSVYNPDQADRNGDGVGDACQP